MTSRVVAIWSSLAVTDGCYGSTAALRDRQKSARSGHWVWIADLVQILLKGYADLFKPGGKRWPTFVCTSVVRPVSNNTSPRYAEVVAVIFNERQPIPGQTLSPGGFGDFEDIQIAASPQYHRRFKYGVCDIAATFQEPDILIGKAKVEPALCVSNFCICWNTKRIVCHSFKSEY